MRARWPTTTACRPWKVRRARESCVVAHRERLTFATRLLDSHPAVKRATPLITNYLLPLLASDTKHAVVEAGHAITAMVERFRNDLGHRPWRLAVADAFLAVLQTEDGQNFSDMIIEDVAKIAGKVDPVSCLDITKRVLLVAGSCASAFCDRSYRRTVRVLLVEGMRCG